jgi:putative tricarboxylic transport membrane protein
MRVSNTVIGFGLILFASAVLLHTRAFPTLREGYPGPALFPNVLAVLFILAGSTLVVQGVRKGERILRFDISELSIGGILNILLILGASVFYIYLSELLGFLIISFIILFGLMKWLGVSALWGVAVSCGVTIGTYLLFAKGLLVPLPWGLWGW